MAMPLASAPRRTLRTQSSDTGPGWAPTNRPSPKPTRREVTPPNLTRRLRPRRTAAVRTAGRGRAAVPSHSGTFLQDPPSTRPFRRSGGDAAAAGQLALEGGQAVVPLSADLGDPGERLRHRRGCGAVEDLAAGATRGDQSRRRERAQVLLHRLAADREPAREIGRG